VKKLFLEKGFCFIVRDDGAGDEFCHANQLKRSGISDLAIGDRVEFELAARDDKFEAVNIRRLDSGSDVDGNTAPGWLNATAHGAVLESSASLIEGKATGNVAQAAPRFGD
jgi:cold shock CspA family protein